MLIDQWSGRYHATTTRRCRPGAKLVRLWLADIHGQSGRLDYDDASNRAHHDGITHYSIRGPTSFITNLAGLDRRADASREKGGGRPRC